MSVTTRQAIMRVSWQMLESLLPPTLMIDCLADKLCGAEARQVLNARYAELAKALLLPADCKVTGVSLCAFFWYDQVAVRMESPAFVETVAGNKLPEVEVYYRSVERGGKSCPYFDRWEGPAVASPARDTGLLPAGPPDGTCMHYQLPLPSKDEPKISQGERSRWEPEPATLDDVRPKVAYVPCDGGVLLPDFEAERLLRDYGKPKDEPKLVNFREFL